MKSLVRVGDTLTHVGQVAAGSPTMNFMDRALVPKG